MNNECTKCNGNPCDKKSKAFPSAVIEIDNPPVITNIRRVVIPASMGDDTTVPPTVGKYKNVLLFYEANSKSYLYSSDGIPTQLVNGVTDYEQAVNLPQINGVTLLGDKSSADLKLADAPVVVHVTSNNMWSSDKTSQEIYELFNSGVNVVVEFDERPSDEKTWPVLQLGYDENNGTLIGIIAIGYTELEETTWNSSFVKIDLRANRTVASTEIRLQEKLTAGDGIEIEDNTISISDIEQYAHFFDTVAAMLASTSLADGDYAKTLGYYSSGDGGGAYYKISSVAPSGYYEVLASGLYAKIITEPTMNVRQFGAKGDGVTDDTVAIQTALDLNSNIQIPDGVYMVDAVTELRPNNGNKIELSKNAKLKAITNDSTHYRIFHVLDVSDVEISGGTLEGDRLTHTGTTGEWGNCIRVYGDCTNIHLHDMNLINAWGDGLGVAITGSIHTERLHIKNARRNGMSLGGAIEFVSTDDLIEDTNGTNPQCGVDIEPDRGDMLLRNVVFNNLNTKNNSANGLEFGLSKDNTGYPSNIQINNYKSEGDNRGIWIEPGENNIGVIEINNPYINNSKSNALFVRLHSTLHKVSINSPIINGYGVTAANSAGIEIQSTADVECGNLDIIHPIVKNKNPSSNNSRAVFFNSTSTKFRNITVLDPIDLDGNNVAFNTSDNKNVRIIDGNGILIDETDADIALGTDTKYGVNTVNYTANHTIRISSAISFPIGQVMKFMNYGDYSMSIYFQNQHIYGITNDLNKTVTTAEKGAYLEIKRINSTDWGVVSKSGTFTTN